MKAKEYHNRMITTKNKHKREIAVDFLFDLYTEWQEISKKRNVKNLDSEIAIMKELNQKANSVIKKLLEDEYGNWNMWLRKDVFKNYILDRIPELKFFWE